MKTILETMAILAAGASLGMVNYGLALQDGIILFLLIRMVEIKRLETFRFRI